MYPKNTTMKTQAITPIKEPEKTTPAVQQYTIPIPKSPFTGEGYNLNLIWVFVGIIILAIIFMLVS